MLHALGCKSYQAEPDRDPHQLPPMLEPEFAMQPFAVGVHRLGAKADPARGHLVVEAFAQNRHDVELNGTEDSRHMRQRTVAM